MPVCVPFAATRSTAPHGGSAAWRRFRAAVAALLISGPAVAAGQAAFPFAPESASDTGTRVSGYTPAQVLSAPLAQPGLSLPGAGILPASEAVTIPGPAFEQAAVEALQEGIRMEGRRQWTDAAGHYEQAVREFPNDQRLRLRHDLARIHSSLERRYADASFVDTLRALDGRAATDLHSELLTKIETHYVVDPPWGKLTERGATAVLIAAADPDFAARHGLRPNEQQLRALAADVRQLARPELVRGSRDALAVAAAVASAAERRVGAPAAAWMLEFTAAAAGGLDNYSAFLTPGQLRDVYSQIEGNFVGLGVELKAAEGDLEIVRVIGGSPAERAGIVAGDRIIAIDGQQCRDHSSDEAASMLTGEEGTSCQVTVVSPSVEFPAPSDDVAHLVAKPLDGQRTLTVRREHVEVPSLEGVEIVDQANGVAYVKLPVFQKSTARDVESALWDLHRQGMRSLVIDLRGNPGGLLTSAVELADKFVAQGNLVSTRGRSDGEDFDYRAHRAGTWRVPLVVMVDGDSASASEIFAAAIRDNRRGTIVGVRSFGKGSVQGIFPMALGGAGIRLTTAKFYSPNGHPISEVGVNPDIVVHRATSAAGGREEGRAQTVGYRGAKAPADEQLQKAIEAARTQAPMR
ncbi:MAG: S41 family peptidase [Lacipirellulaceae bacterium]